jgi:UDPglucose--hexose-1-phosphate uridylyltransferase
MTSRQHLLTGEPILFAPERAARPHAFAGNDHDESDAERCPFCAGHEADTPPPLATLGDPWRVRVVPNKYPPVHGAEVIVESAAHEHSFDQIGHAAEVVGMYVDRYRAHAAAAYTAVFKNHGPSAGASIPHVHSQVMPLAFTPPRIEREAEAFARAGDCPLCRVIETHRRDGLMIRETESFAWLAPSASWMAFQQWLVPKEHAPEITALDAPRMAELALLLRAASTKMLAIGRSYNWMFVNFPRRPAAHWYVDLFPRLTTMAGFELATGTFVEIIDPTAAVRRLR